MMKLEYDNEADAAYVYFVHPIREGSAERQVLLNEQLIIDFDKSGKMLGMEILNAKKLLGTKALIQAKRAC